LRQYRRCLKLIATGTLSVGDIITHRYKLGGAETAFADAVAQKG